MPEDLLLFKGLPAAPAGMLRASTMGGIWERGGAVSGKNGQDVPGAGRAAIDSLPPGV